VARCGCQISVSAANDGEEIFILSKKIVWTDFNLNFYRAVTLAFDRANQTTERGISKNWIFQVLRDFLQVGSCFVSSWFMF